MQVRKSIVFTIDSDVWTEFRMRAVAEDRSIGDLVREWVEEWLRDEDDMSEGLMEHQESCVDHIDVELKKED